MVNQFWQQYNCYLILGINPRASIQEIRRAYHIASLKNHPDRPGGSHAAQVRVNQAYSVLVDPILRQTHDLFWIKPKSNPYSNKNRTSTSSSPRSNNAYKGGFTQNARHQYSSAENINNNQYTRTYDSPFEGLKIRLNRAIDNEKKRIWQTLETRITHNEKSFIEQFQEKRKNVIWGSFALIVLCFFAIRFPILWIVTFLLGVSVIDGFSGIKIEGETFSFFESGDRIKKHAKKVARDTCWNEESKLQKHFTTLAQISELLLRSSDFDDSENQVTRRLTTAFFLMGYSPLIFDRENRTILFTDGEESVLARFRHRSGMATNISYVKKLLKLMEMKNIRAGYLFCSPGLSKNASVLANNNNIRWYSLEAMNTWIENAIYSDYAGPPGNIFSNLTKLDNFLRTISIQIAGTKRARRYRY
jgi:hypothetical protein